MGWWSVGTDLRTENELVPANGIYATVAQVGDRWHRAVTSVGVRPTIGDNQYTIETFILEGEHELYDQRLRVAFVQRLRPEAKFESLAALTVQMGRDVADVRQLFDRMVI